MVYGRHMTNLNSIVANRITSEMDRLQTTRNALASKAGMNDSTLGRKIKGQTSFTISEVDTLATALGLTVLDLMTPEPVTK